MPDDVPRDQTLGSLRRTHAFSLEDLRTKLSQLMKEPASESVGIESPARPVAEGTRLRKDVPMQREPSELPAGGRSAGDPSAFLITGQMSLSEIQAATGIDARELAKRLGLPADVPLDDNLGRLRKMFGTSASDRRGVLTPWRLR